MGCYAATAGPVKVREFTEVLPADGDGPVAIRWVPGPNPGAGVLRIDGTRRGCVYHVREFGTPWDGRAVRFRKAAGCPGSDREAGGYELFVARNRQDKRCGCKGFERWGRCNHLAALEALIDNGWLDQHDMANPEADVTTAEAVDAPF